MKIEEFKSAQAIQIKILAYKKLKEMLEGEHVVLSSGAKQGDAMVEVFSEIFGDTEKRELNDSIKAEMCQMVDGKLDELNSEFNGIGDPQ